MKDIKLSNNEIKKIVSSDIILTNHAKERMKQRGVTLDDFKRVNFAYRNTDGTFNMTFDNLTYFVVKKDKNAYVMITYKGVSHNGFTVRQKYRMAQRGHEDWRSLARKLVKGE